ncbi:MAG: universal stress protein [Desulfobacterales bacterium]|nr:universal stress protein [Desulfobacterales bacterium]MCF8078647.1 universal stress protein [Desulfobacterales bacterium]
MKILLAYDESNAAKGAVRVAAVHAKAFGGHLYVVRSMNADLDHNEIERAQRELDEACALFQEAGIEAEARLLVHGVSAGEDIVKFAEEQSIDQIVIGIKKTSRVGKLLLGSNAQYIILKAPCPVTTVR